MIPYRVQLLEDLAQIHAHRIDSMEDRFLRLDGAFALVKFTLGTSIVTGLLAMVTLIGLLVTH